MMGLVSFLWQLTGEFLTFITVLLALYIFFLNPGRQINQLVSLAIALVGASNVGIFLAIRANTSNQALTAWAIIAAAAPAIWPAFILATLSLVKPKWLTGRMIWLLIIWLVLILVPLVFTAVDLIGKTNVYLELPDTASYSGGFLHPWQALNTPTGALVIQASSLFLRGVLILSLVYLSFLNQGLEQSYRNLAKVILLLLGATWMLEFVLRNHVPYGFELVFSGVIVAIVYAVAVYRQMVITRNLHTGRIQARLNRLIATIVVLLVAFIAVVVFSRPEGNRLITLGVILLASILSLGLIALTIHQTVRPIKSLTHAVQEMASGDISRMAPVDSEDEFGALAHGFNSMALQVRNLIDGLERRSTERTLDLERRTVQLQAAAEVGRATANIRNLSELLPLVTRLVGERFGFYHVGIFLLDENKEYAVLQAANSEGGRRMLARGHRLQVGQQGIVGYVCKQREPRIALNVSEDIVYFNNPDLPDSQSEMALPLIVGTELLGALDVQSTEQNAFTEQDVRTLRVLADQVAIAINSARLVQQLEQVLESERRTYGEISRDAWREQIRSLAFQGFKRTEGGVTPIQRGLSTGSESTRSRRVLQSGAGEGVLDGVRGPTVDPENSATLFIPVKVRETIIGILKLTRSEMSGSWSGTEIELMEKLVEQLGVALESARAYQTTQVNAQRDRRLAEISARVRETLDIDMILKATSQEIRRALGLTQAVVQLIPPGKPGPSQPGGAANNGQKPENPVDQLTGDDAEELNKGGEHE